MTLTSFDETLIIIVHEIIMIRNRIIRTESILNKINSFISIRYTLIYFCLMAALYMFSLFGSMFGSTDFTYADF